MSKELTGSSELPAGRYYVGDPCYAVPNDRWMEWLDGADFANNRWILQAPLDGQTIAAAGTAYGDGLYLGSDGFYYGVDSGLIGVVPIDISTIKTGSEGYAMPVGTIVDFPHPFCIAYDNGVIHVDTITINTADDDEYDDDDDDEDEDGCISCGEPLDYNGICLTENCPENP